MGIVVRVTMDDIETGGRDIRSVLAPPIQRAIGPVEKPIDVVHVHRGLLFAETLETRQKQDYTVSTSWYATYKGVSVMLPLRAQALASFLEYWPTDRLMLHVTNDAAGSPVRRWVRRDQALTEFSFIVEEFEAKGP